MTINLILKNARSYDMGLPEYERLRAECTAEAAPVRGTTLKLLPGNRSALSDSDSNQFYRRKRLLLESIPGQAT